MAARISELILNCADPRRMAEFWCAVLGYVEVEHEPDGSIGIGPPGPEYGPQPALVLSATDNPRTGRMPLHIDINPTDRDHAAELERLLALGAVPLDVGQSGREPWDVLADPEGNEFCLLHRRVDPV